MFFFTYLRGELHRRIWQAVFIALGLALGVGLVVTVAAASAGVNKAQSGVLTALYGVGTDVTVTGPALTTPGQSCVRTSRGQRCGANPAKANPSKKEPAITPGQTYDVLVTPYQEPIRASAVAAVTRLHDVAAATGVLTLVDSAITYPANGGPPHVAAFTVDGVDTGHTSVGPLSVATASSGRFFTAADSDADVAVVDSAYATINNLKVDSTITVGQVRFTVIGIVNQPTGTSPPAVYVPLARAQALATVTKYFGGSVGNRVEPDLRGRGQCRRHSRRAKGDLPTAAQRHRDSLHQLGQRGDRVAVERRQAAERPWQVGVGAGADRRLRPGQPVDDGGGGPAVRRVRHAEGARLADPTDHRPGAR